MAQTKRQPVSFNFIADSVNDLGANSGFTGHVFSQTARLILTKPGNGIQIVAKRRDDGCVITPAIAGKYEANITVADPELYEGRLIAMAHVLVQNNKQ